MAGSIEVKVPDIGDLKEVGVIEVLVAPGDRVEKEGSLITVESDKATMEIPSPVAGVVKELKIKVGDKVAKGSLILILDRHSGVGLAQGDVGVCRRQRSAERARLFPGPRDRKDLEGQGVTDKGAL